MLWKTQIVAASLAVPHSVNFVASKQTIHQCESFRLTGLISPGVQPKYLCPTP